MIAWHRRSWLLALAMVLAAGMASQARPRIKMADPNGGVELAAMVPRQFGEWRVDERIVPIQPSPDVQAFVDKLYNQTLVATFVNEKNERVMLSLAYGEEQSKASGIHRPEVCYPAQGFQIHGQSTEELSTALGTIQVMRLLAVKGDRVEPITYWLRVGDELARGSLQQKLAMIRHGLKGEIADGLLFRVSSITPDVAAGYRLQEQFVRDLLAALAPERRSFFVGPLAKGREPR